MTEIAVLIGPEGVRKTQIFAKPGDHAEGFKLYEKALPGIRLIDATLRTERSEQNEKGAGRD